MGLLSVLLVVSSSHQNCKMKCALNFLIALISCQITLNMYFSLWKNHDQSFLTPHIGLGVHNPSEFAHKQESESLIGIGYNILSLDRICKSLLLQPSDIDILLNKNNNNVINTWDRLLHMFLFKKKSRFHHFTCAHPFIHLGFLPDNLFLQSSACPQVAFSLSHS